MNITQEAKDAIKSFSLPDNVGFGQIIAPVMAVCDYEDGKWGELNIVPYGPISLAPTAKVFHYAQENSYDILVQKGIQSKKVDKGCLILNTSDSEGKIVLRKRPFAKSKEKMCAYELIEGSSPEEAIEVASMHPMAKVATIEVRSIWNEPAGQ